MRDTDLIPKELNRVNGHDIQIVWRDGSDTRYPARWLRLHCPCAACVDEESGEILIGEAEVAKTAVPLAVQLVGHYGISVSWSDGHKTGIYPFVLLKALASELQTPESHQSRRPHAHTGTERIH